MRLLALAFWSAVLFTAAAADTAFNGRWNILVSDPRGRSWWLEVTGAGTPQLAGSFVGAPGGQVDKIPQIRIENGELVFVFEREAQGGRKTILTYRARQDGTKLEGSMIAATEGEPPKAPLPWTGIRAPEIKDVDNGNWKAGPAVALFNGKDTSGWRLVVPTRPGWKVEGGILKNEFKASDIVSDARFWNFILRAEYRYEKGSNSGIGLRGRYELQIFDNFGQPPDWHGNGAIYSRIAPSRNASRPPGEWQELEARIVGRMVTVKLNGVTIIDHQTIPGPTAICTDPNEADPGPISLQGDHGLIEFRKLEIIPLTR